MSNIPKSQLDAVDTRVEVMLRKLFEGRTVNFEDLNGVDILSPDDDDTLFYNFTLDLWENHPLKTINGQSLKGPGNIAISGGSGSPGGSSGQFQWNDSGAFGGTTGYTWNFGTSQPLSTNGYLLGATSSLEEIDGGSLVTTSTTLEPISGLIASVDLISNKSTTATARLNTNSGATNKYLQVEINRSSPRYFNGTALQDVWHTGTFNPTTKQDTLVSGTNIKTINSESLLGSSDISIPVISTLGSISGVVISSPTATQVLTFDGTNWVNSTPSGGGGLTHFTESVNTSAPNAAVPVCALVASNAATNVDVVFSGKGTFALLAQIPDNTATGGNKRGQASTDFQKTRNAATQVASGTDSFIGCGIRNTASGSQSGVVAGSTNISSGTQCGVLSGNNNTASNAASAVVAGASNSASGNNAIVGAGLANLATNTNSGVLCGISNQATGVRAGVLCGESNTASGESSWVPGGVNALTRGLFAAYAWSSARRASQGDNQCIGLPVQRGTTDATATILTADRNAPSTTNVMVLPNNSCWTGTVHITGRSSGGGVYYLRLDVVGARGAGAGTTVVKATNPAYTFTDVALVGVSGTVVADTTRGSLEVQVTGLAGVTIDWFAHFDAGNQIVR